MTYVASTCAVAILITVAVFVRQRNKRRKLEKMKYSATQRIVIHAKKIQENHEVFNNSENGNVYDMTWEQTVVWLEMLLLEHCHNSKEVYFLCKSGLTYVFLSNTVSCVL